MSKYARFPDWSSLAERDRWDAARECRERLAQVGQSLHAVAGTCGPAASGDGVLYVAKDMIATGEDEPSWGCLQPPAHDASIAPVALGIKFQAETDWHSRVPSALASGAAAGSGVDNDAVDRA
jgi:hypothetical protein